MGVKMSKKYVFTNNWGDIMCCGTAHIPFESEDIDQFILDALTILENTGSVNLFDFDIKHEDEIIHGIMTLEKWFEDYKDSSKPQSY